MNRTAISALALLVLAGAVERRPDGGVRRLPAPDLQGVMTLEQAIASRRSQRRFLPRELTLQQVGQLVWAAQGITCQQRGFRASPSAGALFPMEVYVVSTDGVQRYLASGHALKAHKAGDVRAGLAGAALGQEFIAQAPVTLAIAAVFERVTRRYGERGRTYVHIEAGHIGQNVLLQATALGLTAVPVGAFHDDSVREVLSLPSEEVPLYLIPVGYPAE